MANDEKNEIRSLLALIAVILLAVTNPSKAELYRVLNHDGYGWWFPPEVRRVNLFVFSLNYVHSYIGNGFYIGCCGHYFGGKTSKE